MHVKWDLKVRWKCTCKVGEEEVGFDPLGGHACVIQMDGFLKIGGVLSLRQKGA